MKFLHPLFAAGMVLALIAIPTIVLCLVLSIRKIYVDWRVERHLREIDKRIEKRHLRGDK